MVIETAMILMPGTASANMNKNAILVLSFWKKLVLLGLDLSAIIISSQNIVLCGKPRYHNYRTIRKICKYKTKSMPWSSQIS